MIIYLDLTETEYKRFKLKYPVLKDVFNDKPSQYYFETKNPYISTNFGLSIGLPEELDAYVISDD